MAELDRPELSFPKGCPDPGMREVQLPVPLPDIGIDFNWDLRDFDTFRNAMLEELMLLYPERRRWTSADFEVVMIEVLAAVLDQFSDMADRVAAESYLQSARRPESVYNWLRFIGLELNELYPLDELNTAREELQEKIDEVKTLILIDEHYENRNLQQEEQQLIQELDEIKELLSSPENIEKKLLTSWRDNPFLMDEKRRAGPATVHRQKRMTSLSDYALRLEEHPLVERAYSSRKWGGSWMVVWVMVSLWNNHELDSLLIENENDLLPESRKKSIEKFHSEKSLLVPEWSEMQTIRDVLRSYISQYRSIGQEVFLLDIEPIGIDISLCLQVAQNYYQSEVKREALRVLGRGPGSFFEPGRLKVGEDLHMSDFYQRLMSLDGVIHVQVLVFKKVGSLYANQAATGEIVMEAKEIAVCDNDTFKRERGRLNIQLYGGRRG